LTQSALALAAELLEAVDRSSYCDRGGRAAHLIQRGSAGEFLFRIENCSRFGPAGGTGRPKANELGCRTDEPPLAPISPFA
jgi:hypothetical protein